MLTKSIRMRIEREEYPESPREWDNLGTMYCWHSRYNLGDEQPTQCPDLVLLDMLRDCILSDEDCLDIIWDIIRWHKDHAEDFFHVMDHGPIEQDSIIDALEGACVPKAAGTILDKYYVIMPLYLYDHSGITISTSPFSCPWDSGQVGFIAAKLSGMDREKIISILQSEVSTYDMYLRGEVYGFVIEELNADTGYWEETGSCGGFYGCDVDTNGMLDHIPCELHNTARELMST